MNKKGCLFAALTLVFLAILVPFLYVRVRDGRNEAAFQHQLELAQSEGLPTTTAEFVALLPKVRPQENAGPIYQSMIPLHGVPDPSKLGSDVLYRDSARARQAASDAVQKARPLLDKGDAATKLSHCRFERDWAKGIALLMPELGVMKEYAKFSMLRGTLVAAKNPALALAESDRIHRMAEHLREEPVDISQSYALSLDGIADRQVAEWAIRYKDPAYVRALDTASKRASVPNSKYVHARDLIDALSIIEMCKAPEGRRELGLHPEDEDVGAMRVFPLLQAESEGKLRIVRGARRMWAGTKLPADRSAAEINEGIFEMRQGLISFPLAFKIYGLLSDPSESSEFDLAKGQDAKRLAYMAIVRALQQPSIPKSIKTDDLLSPWDQKPIRYSYDGKQMKIEVSRGSGEFKTTKIPSDSALKSTR